LQTGLDKVNVRDIWNQQMGPAIEKYTTAIKLEGSTLFVQLSSSVLREELGYGKEKIIRNINEALGQGPYQKTGAAVNLQPHPIKKPVPEGAGFLFISRMF
jgi:hypothetical protein